MSRPFIHQAPTIRLFRSGVSHTNNIEETKCNASETPFRRYRRAEAGRKNRAREVKGGKDQDRGVEAQDD